MAFGVSTPGRAKIEQRTLRNDKWWLPGLLTVIGLLSWITYATVRVFMQKWFFVEEFHYLTPFYSPCLSTGCPPESALPFVPQFLPDVWWLPYAALTLPFLLLFRFTCYYYRKAYYRSFWLSPPACAVAEPHSKYSGETQVPLLGQNYHRYFFYAAAIISLINTFDAFEAFKGTDGGFGIGLGTVILWINVAFLWLYTASCHSCRSSIGGRLNHFSRHPVRYKLWTQVSRLNSRHMQLAWVTLLTLAVTDFYVMAVSAGWISDFRFFN